MNRIFQPADILLPRTDLTKWAVIACDQFSSQREYWQQVENLAGQAPSALRMIIPEAYLGQKPMQEQVSATYEAMRRYLREGIFTQYRDALIYVQRTLSDGAIRHGLVGCVDLEAYDYAPGSDAPIRASERTVASRLPVRREIRAGAALEMPHVMTLISDEARRIIEPLARETDALEKLYDFDLMQGGGHLCGWLVTGQRARCLSETVDACGADVRMIVGDGNHSLAAAREYWLELKKTLEPGTDHPARYALVEVNNVYDPAVTFHAIHRAAFGVDGPGLIRAMEQACPGDDYTVRCITGGVCRELRLGAESIGRLIGSVDRVLESHLPETGHIDYIHDEAAAAALGQREDAAVFLLPAMGKSDFFDTVSRSGLFPKKSFSIGVARDKRYYLECRALREK